MPAALGRYVHWRAAGVADDTRRPLVDVVVPGQCLLEAAGGAGQVVVTLIGLEEERVDTRLGIARRRGDDEASVVARRESSLPQLKDALCHLVELVEDDQVRINARYLARAVPLRVGRCTRGPTIFSRFESAPFLRGGSGCSRPRM